MTDKKFTDEEIIRALECCYLPTGDCEKDCPMYNIKNCNDTLMAGYVKDLINRQKAEIERLEKTYKADQQLISALNKSYNLAKAEAYKEFAEKLKETSVLRAGCVPWYDIHAAIDYLLKEMVGEKE